MQMYFIVHAYLQGDYIQKRRKFVRVDTTDHNLCSETTRIYFAFFSHLKVCLKKNEISFKANRDI